MNTILLSHNGIDIRKDDQNRVCLNDLWYASGRPGSKAPRIWKTYAQAKEIISHYETVRNSDGFPIKPSRIQDGSTIHSVGGAAGGTYAIREIALAYAGYLDVQLQALIYQAFLDRVDGVRAAMDMPLPMLKTFAGSSKAQRRARIEPVEHDTSYWQGYAAALEKVVYQLAQKEVL